MGTKMIKLNSIVKIKPELCNCPAEIDVTFKVTEDNGNRVFLEGLDYFAAWSIQPMFLELKQNLILVK
jgi:hypothetical protein